jgi:CDGSH-type Zn-finger protein
VTAGVEGPGQVVLCPGGPMLVRGAREVVDADGTRHPVDRPVVAVCRCELSATLPWCDATHKRLPDERRPR